MIKFRWPLYRDKCYECGHVRNWWQMPWYTPRPVPPALTDYVRTLMDEPLFSKSALVLIGNAQGGALDSLPSRESLWNEISLDQLFTDSTVDTSLVR